MGCEAPHNQPTNNMPDKSLPPKNVSTRSSKSDSSACSASWINLKHSELRKTFRHGENSVKLRVLLGGNGLRTPICEIISDAAEVQIGKRGGRTVPKKFKDGTLLPQVPTIKEAKDNLEKWWAKYLKQNVEQS